MILFSRNVLIKLGVLLACVLLLGLFGIPLTFVVRLVLVLILYIILSLIDASYVLVAKSGIIFPVNARQDAHQAKP